MPQAAWVAALLLFAVLVYRICRTWLEPSPMQNFAYRAGESDLISPVPIHTDHDIGRFLSIFRRRNVLIRATLRGKFSAAESGNLITFSRRAAVFALRFRDRKQIRLGLTALAALRRKELDERDVIVVLGLLHHSALSIGLKPVWAFLNAARLAAPSRLAVLFLSFLRRPAESKYLKCWGYAEVVTAAGLGFIQREFHKYEPTYDLTSLVVALRDIVASDKYEPDFVSVGSSLPSWFGSSRGTTKDEGIQRALRNVVACVSVDARLRAKHRGDAGAHRLSIYVAECFDENACAALAALATNGDPGRPSLTFHHDKLLCFVAGFSYIADTEPCETTNDLARFVEPVSKQLQLLTRLR